MNHVTSPARRAVVLQEPARLLAAPSNTQRERSRPWVLIFVGFQIVGQLVLLIPGIGPVRPLARIAVFGASLLFLLLARGRRVAHPAAPAAAWLLLVIVVSLFHPTTNNLLSGVAQAALYFAILAPLFWVPKLGVDAKMFRKLLLIFWVFHTTSAAVGVLQVQFPGLLDPPLSPVVLAQGEGYVESLKITTSSGLRAFRPMGLTDAPGGAAVSGFYAVLFGIGFLLAPGRMLMKSAALGGMLVGLTVIYLSQVRSVLILTLIGVGATIFFLAFSKERRRLLPLIAGLIMVVVLSFRGAVSLGGESVTERLATLTEESPEEVYYTNRGHFLEHTVDELLPKYPLGAGLGRWGMMYHYFGDKTDPARSEIYTEIQLTGWLLDGGVPLILLYMLIIGITAFVAWRITRQYSGSRFSELAIWAAILLAYNIGTLALTFNYPVFIGQSGLEFWLLNAALFAAASTVRAQPRAVQKELPK